MRDSHEPTRETDGVGEYRLGTATIRMISVLILSVFLLACRSVRPSAPPDHWIPSLPVTWTMRDSIVYGAHASDRGPIGGGPAYADIHDSGDYVVRTLRELDHALSKAVAGEVIFIPRTVELDFTARVYAEEYEIVIPSGITLASDRGRNGSRGALLRTDAFLTSPLISVGGPSVRITGLRIEGPDKARRLGHHRRAFRDVAGDDSAASGGHEYYYRLPYSKRIVTQTDGLQAD